MAVVELVRHRQSQEDGDAEEHVHGEEAVSDRTELRLALRQTR